MTMGIAVHEATMAWSKEEDAAALKWIENME